MILAVMIIMSVSVVASWLDSTDIIKQFMKKGIEFMLCSFSFSINQNMIFYLDHSGLE